jgi:hypothetical protein
MAMIHSHLKMASGSYVRIVRRNSEYQYKRYILPSPFVKMSVYTVNRESMGAHLRVERLPCYENLFLGLE